jgi:hypothetical protein
MRNHHKNLALPAAKSHGDLLSLPGSPRRPAGLHLFLNAARNSGSLGKRKRSTELIDLVRSGSIRVDLV